MEDFELKGGRWLPPVLSLFIYPGVGQWRNGQKTKAVLVGLIFTALCGVCIYHFAMNYSAFFNAIMSPGEMGGLLGYVKPVLVWGAGAFGFWILNGIDALIFASSEGEEANPESS